MNATKLKLIGMALAAAVIVGCGTASMTGSPVYNVSGAPIDTYGKPVTMTDVERAIIRAGLALGWQMRPVKPGHIQGTLNLRTHTAVVDITYDTKSYNIAYKDSTNLDYNDGRIHRNYNGWIQNLEKGIRAQMAAI
jgi:hypothetical protein